MVKYEKVVSVDKQSSRRAWWRRWQIWVSIAALSVVVAIGWFLGWTFLNTAEPAAAAMDALRSDEQVIVHQTADWISFTPTDELATTGFIFYAGGLVPAEAYAAHLHDIAAAGYPVYLPYMPLNLAFFDADAAAAVMAAHPTIDRWVIGGHSLGGSMATTFAADNPQAVAGVVLWASYPTEASDLSGTNLPAVTIYGTRDGLIPQEEIEQSLAFLPSDATQVPIIGGNHAQFGRYGAQDGDLEATVAVDEQQAAVVNATLDFLEQVTNGREN